MNIPILILIDICTLPSSCLVTQCRWRRRQSWMRRKKKVWVSESVFFGWIATTSPLVTMTENLVYVKDSQRRQLSESLTKNVASLIIMVWWDSRELAQAQHLTVQDRWHVGQFSYQQDELAQRVESRVVHSAQLWFLTSSLIAIHPNIFERG